MVRTGSRADLDRAHALFSSVTATDPEFAAGWCGLGIAELQYVRHGFGGQIHVMHARRAFDEALKLDPASTEANLYRIYMLLSRGEKESARHGIANLLASAANDWNVHMVAGLALRGDGMYDEALSSSAAPSSSTPPTRRSSITIAPASTTIRIRLSWPATSWKKAWRSSRAIRCCAPRPATSKCAWAISTRPSRFWRA
jgi:tetratricopeptide (TPR) repeat protein